MGVLGEIFLSLSLMFSVLHSGQRQPVPALWLKRVPRIHMIKQSILRETGFPMDCIIQLFRIHS